MKTVFYSHTFNVPAIEIENKIFDSNRIDPVELLYKEYESLLAPADLN